MGITIKDDDNTERLLKILDEIERTAVEVGIFGEDGSFYVMIGSVNEFGITIRPKNAKALTIPVNPKAHRKRASDFPDLFRPKGTNVLAIPRGRDGFEVLFVLMQKVVIPERSFIRSTFDEQEQSWSDFLQDQVTKVIDGKLSVRSMFDRLGSIAAADIQQTMATYSSPANAPATIAAKESSQPLIDTGALRQRVTWKVVDTNV